MTEETLPIQKMSNKQYISTLPNGAWAWTTQIGSYFLLYFVLNKLGIPLFFIIFTLIGTIAGSLVGSRFSSRIDHYRVYVTGICAEFVIFIGINLAPGAPLTLIFLFLFGFIQHIMGGIIYEHVIFNPDEINQTGSFRGIAILVIIIIIFTPVYVICIVYGIFSILVVFLTKISKDSHRIFPQERLSLISYIKNTKKLPIILFSFFLGMTYLFTFYSVYTLLSGYGFASQLPIFAILLFVGMAIAAYPAGVLMDRRGRKIVIFLGFCIEAATFLVISFFAPNDILYLWILPVLLGCSQIMLDSGRDLQFGEAPGFKFLRVEVPILYVFHSIGALVGLFIAEALRPLALVTPAFLSLVLVFAILMLFLATAQLKETLPTKDEIEWKRAIQYIFILNKDSGIPLYTQNLTGLATNESIPDESLIGGALIAVSQLLKEISRQDKALKTVQQEGFQIMIEEGKFVLAAIITLKELKQIRERAVQLVNEFEDLFEDILPNPTIDVNMFIPAKKIIQRIFQ